MKSLVAALALAGVLAGCAFVPPKAPMPDDKMLVPVNSTMPPALRNDL